MEITLSLPMLLFLMLMTGFAGFVDSAAGGGGLISLPAYLFAGLPVHYTYGTNKFSAACGTTFAIIAFTTLMGFDLRTAGGNAKVLNLASNYASLVTYLSSGLVVFSIGIPCAISGIVGNLLGSHFALKNGAKFIRPMMLVVLVLLLGKIVSDAVL